MKIRNSFVSNSSSSSFIVLIPNIDPDKDCYNDSLEELLFNCDDSNYYDDLEDYNDNCKKFANKYLEKYKEYINSNKYYIKMCYMSWSESNEDVFSQLGLKNEIIPQ
jgi:hypothetical protein